uniref:Maturase n=1 Tax=Discoplastis spathirhyncha TaxID=215771 RepID=A0A3G3LL77_9EUGL|nr:maturase [Discoplastis spathirhyncha]AYQ93474.1 maturase [Discoplastis spathirhyncha]
MHKFSTNLFNYITNEDFLFYSWIDLKKMSECFINFYSIKYLKPISKVWFKKFSFLIKSNKIKYKKERVIKFNDFFLKNSCIKISRFAVLQNAIIIATLPFFEKYYISKNKHMKEYLRIYRKFNFKFFKKCDISLSLGKKSFYLKSNWKTKHLYQSLVFSSFNNSSVHSSLIAIKKWNVNLGFFLSFDLETSFNSINRNRLKNIFLKTVEDYEIWFQIEKMWDVGLIDFSISFLKDWNFFSKFLFNIYLAEVDFYVTDSLSLYFDSYFYSCNKFRMSSLSKIVSLNFISLKVGKSLIDLHSLKNARNNRLLCLSQLSQKSNDSKLNCFEKKIHFVRYLNSIFIGVIGSKNFALEIKEKILYFLKGNLYLSVSFSKLDNVMEKNVFFLSHSIQVLISKSSLTFTTNNLNKSFLYRKDFIFRLKKIKSNVSKIAVSRIYNELKMYYNKLLKNEKNFDNLNNNKIWLLLFQFESLRSLQLSKLVLTEEKFNIFPNNFFFRKNKISHNLIINYQQYFFDLYLVKVKNFLRDYLYLFPIFKEKSFFPLDLSFEFLLIDLNKKLSFFYNITVNLQRLRINKLRYFYLGKVNEFFGLIFSFEDLNILANLYISSKNFDYSFLRSLKVNLPLKSVFIKLRNLGFIHSYKFRSISNSKYLFFDDLYIINYYSYIVYFIVNWFGFSDNFVKVKVLIQYIRQSCFLTLCRKHNKNKTWSYNVYTDNLVLGRNLFINHCKFPDKKKILKLNNKFFFENILFI